MENILSQQSQMIVLFDTYYRECPQRTIEYTAYEKNQSWIVMSGIELSFMEYQGSYQPIFMCGREDEVYYFKTYSECEKVWLMDEPELKQYVESLQIINKF